MTTTQIQIERLTTGTLINVEGFGPAEAFEIKFDGFGYTIAYCTDARGGWDALDHVYVDAGTSVEFVGHGSPSLRAEASITDSEWRALGDAISAGIDRKQGELNRNLGHVCREIDEQPLVAAVAEAIGVPALMAAE